MKKAIYKSWPYLLLLLIIAVCAAILEGLVHISMMNAIDTVFSGNRALFKSQAVKLILLALLLLPAGSLLALGKGLFKKNALLSAKEYYVKGVFNKNISEFQKDNIGKYISAITNDINTIENNYVIGIYEILINIIYFIVAIGVIIYVSPMALVLGLTIGITSSAVAVILNRPIQRHHMQRSELYEKYTAYIKEVLSAFHIIKSNNLNSKVRKDFYDKSYGIQEKGYVIDKIETYITALQNLTIYISLFLLLGITSYMAIKGKITFGGVVLVINNIERIMNPVMIIGERLPKMLATKKLFEKIDESLENKDNYVETVELESFNDGIQFKDVSFAYDDGYILDNVNISLKKGKKYLIVGPSGGGKSTFLKLLRKYFLPNKGRILIDGKDLKDVRKESYFKHISNVEQDVFLFEDTLRNNISLYKDYSDEEILEAIEKAGLKDFVRSLPQGLDSMIYDNGKNISGGEKSRIAIARSLLQKSDIMLLDEAFASLDSKTAKEIENTLLNLKDITLVNVSHVVFKENRSKYDQVLLVKDKSIKPLFN
ncbi:MAG: ABC transporter ATP-binding protein [Tissierellia bacterium]|nr:ABC transporter ATP-binding protein [Tissierellia bacterium]